MIIDPNVKTMLHRLPRPLRLPAAAVVTTASVAAAAARLSDARWRTGRHTNLTTTAYSLEATPVARFAQMPVTAQEWPPVRVARPRACFVGRH